MTKKRTILMVDDNPCTYGLVKQILGKNFNVNAIRRPDHILEILKNSSIDLLLIDLHLERASGLDLTRFLRKNSIQIPIVIMTSDSDKSKILDVFECGATDYVPQPFHKDELLARILAAIKAKDLEIEKNRLWDDLSQDLDMACQIQTLMLPVWCSIRNNCLWTSLYLSSAKVGGDILEFTEVNNGRTFALVGDISGHGIQAALLMPAVRAIFHMVMQKNSDQALNVIATELSSILTQELLIKNYMTALILEVDTDGKNLFCLNLGHPPLLKVNHKSQEIISIEHKGAMPIGWISHDIYGPETIDTIPLEENFSYWFYTDGLFDFEMNHENVDFFELFALESHQIPPYLTPFTLVEKILAQENKSLKDDVLFGAIFPFTSSVPFLKKEFRVIESSLKEISETVIELRTLFLKQTQNEYFANALELVLAELLNNIALHGNIHSNQPLALLQIQPQKMVCQISIFDRGQEWSLPQSTSSSTDEFDDEAVSGRGLEIVNHICQHLSLERIGMINHMNLEIPYASN